MGESATQIRLAAEPDFETIVGLNAAEEIQTSPMSLERLELLHGLSSYHKVAVVDGRVAGFLLALREGTPYRNDNYAWFASRYRKFVYVDRIVVSPDFAGMKIGTSLYADLFEYARGHEVPCVVCEYNIEPPNAASRAFHDKFGFSEVGVQRVAGGSKLVTLQAAEVVEATDG